MDALGGSWWSTNPFNQFRHRGRKPRRRENKHNASSSESSAQPNSAHHFPLKQALTAGSLALAGDTIAQLRQRWTSITQKSDTDDSDKDTIQSLLSSHDWLRALRMTSYGFLLYGPGSYVWYQTLDRYFPQPTVQNLLTKVLLNQIILGPSVIAVVFAWNNLWQGKLCELPRKYQKDALPTLLVGFRFWVPYSVLNFWVVPLQTRVAFMSFGSIFWNFILSSTMTK
ncbi:protein SYM1-like [Chenopodium quinoa]|uniref:protein SYM1-like n=1 Tax=Chenopodium quinoa TaxID=63459 RepID=UPI000B783875|nr:protein SYM1-like [Chenopodium quinoa]